MTSNTEISVVKGEISESLFLLKAAKKEWAICIPLGRSRSHDFLAKIPNEGWKAIQVKTVGAKVRKNGRIERYVGIRKGLGKNYIEGDYDYLFAASEQTCWFIPWKEIKDKTSAISLDCKIYNKFIFS